MEEREIEELKKNPLLLSNESFFSNISDLEDDANFVYPPSQNLYCPICMLLFRNPVITKECGHSFCGLCLNQIENSTCPLCRTKISLNELRYNLILDQIVKELSVWCRYKSNGCLQSISLINKKNHEKQCKFGPTKCIHASKGCKFSGTNDELEKHLTICPYELLKPFIHKMEESISSLKAQIELQANQIGHLKELIQINHQIPSNDVDTTVLQLPQRQPSPPQDLADEKTLRKAQWNSLSLKCEKKFSGHTHGVTSLVICLKKNLFFSGSHDSTIRVWDLTSGQSVSVIQGHKYTIWALVITLDETKFFSGSSDGTIKCWDTTDFKCITTLQPNSGKVYSLLLHDNILFSAGSGGLISVWDCSNFQLIRKLSEHKESVWCLYIRNEFLYTGSDDKTIKVWNLNTFDCIHTIQQNKKVLSLAVSEDYICAGTDDCKIQIWNRSDCSYLKSLSEHNWEVWQLFYSDGLLFSGSFDHTIKVWDLETFGCIKSLTGHKGYVHSLIGCGSEKYANTNNSSTNGQYFILSGSGDKIIKLWKG